MHSIYGQRVQRAGRAARCYLEHMGVDHGGGNIAVAQQLLHGADVGAGLQQVGGEGVAQGVDRDGFVNASLSHGLFDGPL